MPTLGVNSLNATPTQLVTTAAPEQGKGTSPSSNSSVSSVDEVLSTTLSVLLSLVGKAVAVFPSTSSSVGVDTASAS